MIIIYIDFDSATSRFILFTFQVSFVWISQHK